MELEIDHLRCSGNGRCIMVNMELFDLDDKGYGVVQDAHPGAEHRDDIDLAIKSCPEHAISYE